MATPTRQRWSRPNLLAYLRQLRKHRRDDIIPPPQPGLPDASSDWANGGVFLFTPATVSGTLAGYIRPGAVGTVQGGEPDAPEGAVVYEILCGDVNQDGTHWVTIVIAIPDPLAIVSDYNTYSGKIIDADGITYWEGNMGDVANLIEAPGQSLAPGVQYALVVAPP